MPSPVQTQLLDMSGNMSGDSVVPNDMDPSAGSRFCISGPKGCANLRAETEFLPDNPRCSYCRHTSASSRTTRKKPKTSTSDDPYPRLTELAASYRVPEGSDLIWCVGIDHPPESRATPSREFRPREPYPCEDHRGAQSWRIRRDILCDACRENRDPVTGTLVSGVYPIAQVHYMPTDYFGLTRSKKMDWWYLAIRRAGLRRDPRVMMAQGGGRVLGYEEVLGDGKELGQQQQQDELPQEEDTMMTDANASSIFSSNASPSTCSTTPIKQQGGFEEINLDDIDAYTDEQWNATLAVMDEGLANIEVGFNGGLFEYEVKQQSDFGLAVPVPAGQQQTQNATGTWEMPEHNNELSQLASLQAYVHCSDQSPELKPEPQGAQEADMSIHSDGPSLFIKYEVTSPPAQLVTPKDNNNNTSLVAAADNDDDDDGDNLPLKRTQAPARVKRIIESLLSEDMGLVCTTCGEQGRVELLFRGFVMSDYDAALRPDWRQCLCCFEANPRP